jgi:ribosomal subunit interface protein
MEIKIKATNTELTDYLKKLVDQKIKKIGKFLSDYPDLIIEVELEKEGKHHQKGEIFRAEAQIKLPGKNTLRAVSNKENFRLALTEVKESLLIQIKKYKEKNSIEKRKKSPAIKEDF